MDKSRSPSLSLIVPCAGNAPLKKPSAPVVGLSEKISQHPPQIHSRSNNGILPAKQKRLFPVACRLVPMDQWFTTRVDRTWNVLDLKVWLLSKALPTPALPLPASYRPSSPVTFAAAPIPQPRAAADTSYHAPMPPVELTSSNPTTVAVSHTVSPISPITFAAAPVLSSRSSTSTSHHSPATPLQQVFYPPLSSAVDTISSPASPEPSDSSSTSSPRVSFDPDDEDVPLYANSYGAVLDHHFDDEDDEDDDDDEVVRIPPSIPYSYNTGAPAISGLAALKSNPNKNFPGRGYGGSLSSADMDLVRKATAIAKRWLVYSFSTGMLLSDDLPLTEYSIYPHELLELHRAGAYVPLPRAILPGLDSKSPSHNGDTSKPTTTSTKTTYAYPSTTTRQLYAYPAATTRQPSSHHSQADVRDSISSESSDDEHDVITVGSPYAQPYFDGWVYVLDQVALGSNGSNEPVPSVMDDVDGPQARKMRRRGRAKSEAAKSGRGKDRARMEREWKEAKPTLGKEGEAEVHLQQSNSPWKRRWLIVRDGVMTVWKERKDQQPEERFKMAACAELYGAEKIQSLMAVTSHNLTPFPTPLVPNATPPHVSDSASIPSTSHHVICARFRQPSHRIMQVGRMDRKSSRRSHQHNDGWLVLQIGDVTIHEHLLRIFHRLSYSSPVTSSTRHSTTPSSIASSRTQYTRTLRTNFVPNPIPHPLSLSFSAPRAIEQGDGSPISPFDDLGPSDASDDEWVDAGSSWGRPRLRATGKGVARYVGLGRGMGVRYPEWRENIIQNAIHAGRGLPLPESSGRLDLSPETPRGEQLDMYGFVREDVDNYTTILARDDYDSDNSDSDAFSEVEWEGWAYDLDRPKAVDETGTAPGHIRKPTRDGLSTPQGSPVSDPELIVGPISDDHTSPSTSTLRPRSLSFSSPVLSNVSPPVSPPSPSPTIPGARLRASTVSSHPRNSTVIVAEPINQTDPGITPSASSQMDHGLHPNVTTTLRTFEPNTGGGVRGLMRGLSMRAGKESFMRGLENALDFVEGK